MGEETGNLNLIFRDQFTKTGIIPGSSIRGRFRADMRSQRLKFIEKLKRQPETNSVSDIPPEVNENHWYGHETIEGENRPKDGGTTEAIVKFEYASLVWLPVFCPGQPIVWITCPHLLKRFQLITGIQEKIPKNYTASKTLQGRQLETAKPVLFFNLGFMEIEQQEDLGKWIPVGTNIPKSNLLVVENNDISMLHDMGLYRQSRVKLSDNEKKVDAERGAFFNVEALPEGSVLIFPIASKEVGWKNALETGDDSWEKNTKAETVQKTLYFGGLESIGFGRCQVTIAGGC